MELRAFISYRRSDAFMPPSGSERESPNFIANLADGLVEAGFK
jgi:hypothetical protein